MFKALHQFDGVEIAVLLLFVVESATLLTIGGLLKLLRSFWHSSDCYCEAPAYFCIANALEVLIHFDMLIREHYARNEIKWQHEVICLSLN